EKSPARRFATAVETAEALRESLAATGTAGDTDSAATVAILDALSRGRLVGRAAELAKALEFWRRAREGHGHAVLLSGEPGAGKTRLAREITIQAAVDGAVVLTGGCYEYEATTPYLPFVEAFRRWTREQKDDAALRAVLGEAAAQIAKLAPEIDSRLGPFPEHPSWSRMRKGCFSSTPSRKCLSISPVKRDCSFTRTTCTGPTAARSGSSDICCDNCAKGARSSSAPIAIRSSIAHTRSPRRWSSGTANAWSRVSPCDVSTRRRLRRN